MFNLRFIAHVMAKRLILILCSLVLLFRSRTVFSQSDEFFYEGFKQVGQNITLTGAADIEHNGILRLTNDTGKLLAHAFQSNSIQFKNKTTGKVFSFSTAFAFAMVPEFATLGGHGMAFAISRTKTIPGALSRQYLGLVNATDNGNFTNHIFAVEFDTVQDMEFNDMNDNHIGIDINSLDSKANVSAAYFTDGNSTLQPLNLKCGKTIQAWVDYDSTVNVLNVTLSLSSRKPINSVLSFHVDLSPFFEDYMYVGFSASTGLLSSSHYVSGWSFKMNGQAQSLDLSDMPSLPSSPKNHEGMILGASISAVIFLVLAVLFALYMVNRIKNMDVIEDWERHVGPHRYSYKELKQATKVVCGRRPIEAKALPEELVLVDWVWDRWKKGTIFEVVDPKLVGHYDEVEVVIVLKLGLMCSNNAADKRPTIRQVVRYLEEEAAVPDIVLAPDEHGGKKSGDFDDFVHSYPTSANFGKLTAWSSEANPASPLSSVIGSSLPVR
ncbi:OLC1v1027753C1 [Oldenlandia corymbosa var. corymbosa]|uniref:non-specific serine/threonine protein kinase n=1 Tax=Oldenlandia corymbosa var. corymbosa TaxID=529605 RepID=A0AAV1CC16_OLDCO|nr:OLC1v1027753C1 [Oldenlandia corymbosa var. corymbosa]